MKKFLLFLVSLVVVVCVGLTTYYFVRNNEIITIKTKEIYCNAGDSIPLESLGIDIKKPNKSNKTTFNYNAGGEDVEKFIKYDEKTNSYVVSQENAGEVVLIIRTSNKKYSDFTINVHIGNGSAENPYFIFNETDLGKIGSVYSLDACYKLMNDINLTSNFTSIGYNALTKTWDGFSGTFNGQNHTISGLNLSDVDANNVGFFSSINANATVSNLILNKATITGDYENASILTGVLNGNAEKVVVKNSTITNTSEVGNTGSIAGKCESNLFRMSYAENVKLNIGTEEAGVSEAIVGGLIGRVDGTTVQACYANNVEIKSIKEGVIAGGLVGEFVIGTETGSIQQSYANTTCTNPNYAAFIGEISVQDNFDILEAKMLRYLIGNIAVVYGSESSSSITDNNLVKSFDNTFFKNTTFEDRSAFFDKDSALYLIRGYASAGEVVSTKEFVFYAVSTSDITNWDTEYVWNTNSNSLPTLRMGNIYPAGPTSEYLRRNMEEKQVGESNVFLAMFNKDVKDARFALTQDIDLSSGWTPVSITNSTFDGCGHTITIDLNNSVEGRSGLFTIIENSTIKNLNIHVKGVSANAEVAGALAGIITSNDLLTSSNIENVNVTFENNFATPAITNFGGLAGIIENTIISNAKVLGLSINAEAQVENAGGLVAVVGTTAKVENCEVEATLSATQNCGGFVAINSGVLSLSSGNITIHHTKAFNIVAGGVVAENQGAIDNCNANIAINVENANGTIYIAGIVAKNRGSVANTQIDGNGIAISNAVEVAYIGGVAAENSGSIENVKNAMATVGSYVINKSHYVGGVVAINSGKISKVLTQSDLFGNYVSGVVAIMNESTATIDQVAVGKYNASEKSFGENQIVGDKYLAGVVVEFKAGTITNIQATSRLDGKANSTRSSLVTLVFPYGATLKNATINSSINGYGTKYREVWTDFAAYGNKAEFGFENGATGDERFNLYKYDTYHGCMQSVVINSAKNGVDGANASLGSAFAWGKDYQDTNESSFIKVVNGFNDLSQFQGSYTFVACVSAWFEIKHNATKTLTFEIGRIWESNNGISLIFLNNI